jgi:hypothetical protein
MADMLSTQSYISDQIANELQSLLFSMEKEKVTRIGPKNPGAYKFYLLGRYLQLHLTIQSLRHMQLWEAFRHGDLQFVRY